MADDPTQRKLDEITSEMAEIRLYILDIEEMLRRGEDPPVSLEQLQAMTATAAQVYQELGAAIKALTDRVTLWPGEDAPA